MKFTQLLFSPEQSFELGQYFLSNLVHFGVRVREQVKVIKVEKFEKLQRESVVHYK